MKFQNGGWVTREGHGFYYPAKVYEIDKTESSVTLITQPEIFGMSNGILTIKITAPMADVIRVQSWHYMGQDQSKWPKFDLNIDENYPVGLEEQDNVLKITSGNMSLIIDCENWSMRYERDGELITRSSGKDLAYVKTNDRGEYYSYESKDVYMVQHLGLSVGELIYGLGERFTPFVRNGQTVEIWNEDGGTSTELSYKNIPFYISNKGYGVLVNHPEKVSFEVGSEYVNKVSFSVPGEYLDYMVINGPSMLEVIEKYTDLSGKPALLPEWTFGTWLSTSFVTSYDEKTVLSFINGMIDRGIPLSVFHFDCLWMKGFHWTDFTWDSDIFPDPEGLLKKIHDKGIKVCVWINPYVGQRSSMFAEGKEKGYFLKRENGDVWQWDMWQPGLAIVDFTNPDACKWYEDKLKGLMAMGVDCFKTDFGERIPTDAVYYNGMDPEKMHNYYSYIYNQLVFETIKEVKGENEAVVFARSATVGGQKFPVHWGGDSSANYESMAESLRGGLSLTSSGFGYWSHDIGGFEDTSAPDVYIRWAQFGFMSSHTRFHGSHSYRVPWNYGEEAVESVRFFAKLKMSLMPYFYAMSVKTATKGIPMMRSMVMSFTEDLNCQYLDKQYMMGDSLLVAPIFNEEGVGRFYLPEGTWTEYLTGEKFSGGRWYEKVYDLMSMPIFVKENSIIPVGSNDSKPDYDYADAVEFRVYELKDTAKACVYKGYDEVASCEVSVSDDGKEIFAKISSDKACLVRLVNWQGKINVGKEDAKVYVDGNDTVIAL